MSKRILAVDPGEVNLGIAISDPTATIASPLTVLQHTSRQADAQAILELARQHEVERIIVGQSLDEKGNPTFQGRRAARLAAALRALGEFPVELWDESFSTRAALQARRQMGVKRAKRRGHLDDLAATVILQSYLNARG
ncbi:MAG: Holliday junction resolvase RuvX [Anaerolineae bacterium]|nr:MAG: Holliday junction resolvase RuvX [Anaerolineae bacterium]